MENDEKMKMMDDRHRDAQNRFGERGSDYRRQYEVIA